MKYLLFAVLAASPTAVVAQGATSITAESASQSPQLPRKVNRQGQWMQGKLMPARTMLSITPLQEISSKHAEVGQKYNFATVGDVTENGFVVIPRGSNVIGEITWKTGRAVGGKSGKFEIEFRSVEVNGEWIQLTGKHRQEGRGNSIGALLGSMVISGRSAVMEQGQLVTAFTAQPVPY